MRAPDTDWSCSRRLSRKDYRRTGSAGSPSIIPTQLWPTSELPAKSHVNLRCWAASMWRIRIMSGTPSCSLLVRTYADDAQRLEFLLKSIDKYCKELDEYVVVCRERCRSAIEPIVSRYSRFKFSICPDYDFDYIGQQITKLRSHIYTNCDFVLHVDSDCIFIKPFDLASHSMGCLCFITGSMTISTEKRLRCRGNILHQNFCVGRSISSLWRCFRLFIRGDCMSISRNGLVALTVSDMRALNRG